MNEFKEALRQLSSEIVPLLARLDLAPRDLIQLTGVAVLSLLAARAIMGRDHPSVVERDLQRYEEERLRRCPRRRS
jgi:hypothetical protein